MPWRRGSLTWELGEVEAWTGERGISGKLLKRLNAVGGLGHRAEAAVLMKFRGYGAPRRV